MTFNPTTVIIVTVVDWIIGIIVGRINENIAKLESQLKSHLNKQ